MIGQKNLLKEIDRQLEDNTFPRFSIVVGERGSESDKIGVYIANHLKANCITVPDVKVDTIRTIIQESYKVASTTVYNIVNADTMSAQAQNALLKVTEEPPNKAYFIMTLEDEINTLPTIKSRGTIYHCDEYSKDEILEYYHTHYKGTEDDIIYSLCRTPGEVDILLEPKEFYEFMEKVVDNISEASGSNVFKIAEKVKFKDTDNGYDLIMFWRAFAQICFDRQDYERVALTSQFLSSVRIKALNKGMLFDKWILDIRRLSNGSN